METERTNMPVGTKHEKNCEEGSRTSELVRKERGGEDWWRDGQGKWVSTEG